MRPPMCSRWSITRPSNKFFFSLPGTSENDQLVHWALPLLCFLFLSWHIPNVKWTRSSLLGLSIDWKAHAYIYRKHVGIWSFWRLSSSPFFFQADVLEYYDQTVNSPSGSFYIPAVLRVCNLQIIYLLFLYFDLLAIPFLFVFSLPNLI